MEIDKIIEKRDGLNSRFQAHSEKYTYYVIALAAASIAFSVNLTIDEKLQWVHLPLGISILLWLSSAYFGLRNLQWTGSHYYANIALLDIETGHYPPTQNNPHLNKIATDVILEQLEIKSNMSKLTGARQMKSFYAGVFLFIVWRILDMLP